MDGPADRLTLNVGSGYVTESDGLLGSRGFGALALDGGLDLQTVHVGARFDLDEQVQLTARLEQGRGDSRNHSGALNTVRGITTEQAQIGLNVQGDTHQGTCC